MNLEEIRQEFVRRSGRYDLVTARGDDNGANFFIASGNRFLDRTTKYLKSEATKEITVATGYSFNVDNCRVITEVWAKENMAERKFVKLERRTEADLLQWFPAPWEDIQAGHPLTYAVNSFRTAPETNQQYQTWTVLFMPRINNEFVFRVHGEFASRQLSQDNDRNFWSTEHPDILLMSALRSLEIFYRNSQGVQDWTQSIAMEIDSLEKDFVQDETTDINQMEG